jgi:hypothetical protein
VTRLRPRILIVGGDATFIKQLPGSNLEQNLKFTEFFMGFLSSFRKMPSVTLNYAVD